MDLLLEGRLAREGVMLTIRDVRGGTIFSTSMQPSLSPDNPFIVAGSHPVGQSPNMRERLARARTAHAAALGEASAAVAVAPDALGAPATTTLMSDRVNYLVGERPSYELSNAAP